MSFKVCRERCDECLFSPGKIVSDERRCEVLETCQRTDAHFICHKASIRGEDVCCRGFYDTNPAATNLMRGAMRLRAVKFVAVEPSDER